jgi:hypothetical protein
MSPASTRFDDTRDLWPHVPHMRISMLGAAGSGKSSYLSMMYHNIVRGNYSYTFKADTEVRLRVNAEIDALRRGKQLEPTDETSPKKHQYTIGALREGVFTALAGIELTDFRGGAILYPGAAETDSAQLYAQLPESDSVFVVFDGTHFTEPLTPARYEALAGATNVNHIATLIGGLLVDRQDRQLPSVAVLLTKSDTITGPGRKPGEIKENVRALLPVAFDLGGKSGFFPVSIGEFVTEDGTSRLAAIGPDGVAAPVFFAVACFLADHQVVLRGELQRIETSRRDAQAQRDRLHRWPPFIQRYFLQWKIDQLTAVLDRMDSQLRAYGARVKALAAEEQILREWLRPALWRCPR